MPGTASRRPGEVRSRHLRQRPEHVSHSLARHHPYAERRRYISRPAIETAIYYFTGTGNSLAVARGLCERLGDCRAVPIASLREEPGPIRPAADRVGFVYPVSSPASRRSSRRSPPASTSAGPGTSSRSARFGGSGATPSLRQRDRVLRAGAGGRGLDAGFAVRMLGNYIVLYGREEDGAVERILTDADRQVTAIAEAVSHDEQTMPGFSPVGAVIHGTYYPRFLAGVHGADAKFTVDDRCTACGTCVAVCPVGNVQARGRPAGLAPPLRPVHGLHPALPGRGDPGQPEDRVAAAVPPSRGHGQGPRRPGRGANGRIDVARAFRHRERLAPRGDGRPGPIAQDGVRLICEGGAALPGGRPVTVIVAPVTTAPPQFSGLSPSGSGQTLLHV